LGFIAMMFLTVAKCIGRSRDASLVISDLVTRDNQAAIAAYLLLSLQRYDLF
jgi:hypothetical protein